MLQYGLAWHPVPSGLGQCHPIPDSHEIIHEQYQHVVLMTALVCSLPWDRVKVIHCRFGGTVTGSDDQELVKIAADMRRYLERHPNAMDTLEGIASWWIPLQRYEEAREKVAKALSYLESRGEISRREMPDGRTLFLKPRQSREPSGEPASAENLNGGTP